MCHFIWTIVIFAKLTYTSTDIEIVNGTDASITEVPYQVSLQEPLGKNRCGGVIISRRWVLTAIHCNKRVKANSYVVVGMTSKEEGGVNHKIEKFIPHPKRKPLIYDMGLIKTKTPFVYNERVQPVLVPKDDQPLPIGAKCTVAGWGRLTHGGILPDNLHKTELIIFDPDYCYEKYKKAYFYEPEACLICAGVESGVTKTCHGDSGGGLVCDGIVYGLVSYGIECASAVYPVVFTHVYNLREFIYFTADFD